MPSARRLLREPLLHFLLLGAGLFVLFRLTGGPGTETARRIDISTAEVQRLALAFSRLWMRPPTADELRGLIEQEIREEVFYREAMAMGLDRDDSIVRRRLQQKLEFLSEDVAVQQKPTEAELQAYLLAHPDRFGRETRLTFRQVYLHRDGGGAEAARRSEALLARLRAEGASARLADRGDRISLPAAFERTSASDVARDFGPPFAAALLRIPTGHWEGPVESGYGLHLVLVEEHIAGSQPPLSEVREAVLREWQAERKRRVNADLYKAMRGKYVVSVELPEWAARAAREAPSADSVEAK
jgi:hypothetical protein